MIISRKANRLGLTIGDARSLLDEVERAGIPDDATLKAQVGWTGRLRELSVDTDQDARS